MGFAALLVVTAGLVALAGLLPGDPADLGTHTLAQLSLLVVYPLVTMGSALLVAHAAVSDASATWPAIGMFLAATLAAGVATVRLSRTGAPLDPSLLLAADILATSVVAGLSIAVAVTLGRTTAGIRRLGTPLGRGVLLVGFAHVLVTTGSGLPVVDVFATASALCGAALYLVGSAFLVRSAIGDQRDAVTTLSEQLSLSRGAHRESRQRLHSLANSVAGITSAQQLLQAEGSLSEAYRRRLEALVVQETATLAELLRTDSPRQTPAPASRPDLLDPAAPRATFAGPDETTTDPAPDRYALAWTSRTKEAGPRDADRATAQ